MKSSETYGKIPPQAIEIEEAVLGALLIEPEQHDFINSMLDVFYRECNQKIFDVIRELYHEKKNIDLLTVCEHLRKKGTLDEVGGISYVSCLTSGVASASHLNYHYHILLEKYILREAIREASELMNKAFAEVDIEDLDSDISRLSNFISNAVTGEVKGNKISVIAGHALQDAEKRMNELRQGISSGIHCGIHRLHEITGGWQKSDLIVIAARPSMGKTAVAIQFAKWPAMRGTKVLFFSLEMDEKSITNRAVLGETSINPEGWRNGQINNEDLDFYDAIRKQSDKWNLKIYDQSGIRPDHIRTVIKKEKPEMVIIDYLQLMNPPAGVKRNANRNDEVGSITRELKRIAKEFEIPVILLCQLNRSLENRSTKIPTLADLRDSGEIEQDADLVIFPYRPFVYDKNPDNKLKIEFIIAKHRNGRTGTIEASHNEYLNKFFDYVNEGEPGINAPVDIYDFKPVEDAF